MPKAVLAVSLSAVQAYRSCEQLYYYRYVERLRRKDRAVAPELGTILHDYLAHYYIGLRSHEDPTSAHSEALLLVEQKYRPTSRRMAQLVAAQGQQALATEIHDLPDKAKRIAERYFKVHGKEDADAYEIILVEEFLTLPLFKKRAVSNGRLDMVARDTDSGRVYMWEHKSTAEVPEIGHRLRDLQTPLYKRKLERMKLSPSIDSVLWNYIRTKEPTVPDELKKGGLTTRANLDSTWEVYKAKIDSLGLNEEDYELVKRRLDGRETAVYFPRFDQPILSTDVLYRDFLQTVKDIARSRRDWALDKREPVRNLSLNCNWCEMASLCNAAVLAGDDSDVKAMRFTVGS